MAIKLLSMLQPWVLASLLTTAPLAQAGGISIHFGHGFHGQGFQPGFNSQFSRGFFFIGPGCGFNRGFRGHGFQGNFGPGFRGHRFGIHQGFQGGFHGHR
jgi:hypothetical protein